MLKISSNENSKEIKILFIARTYPPLVGGMERFASDFHQFMKKLSHVKLLANPKGKKNIVFFFFRVLFFLLFNANKFDLIHFNDAILAPLVPLIRLFSNTKITFTVHGLDIVYSKFGYQYLVIPFLRHADQIFPVSHYTKKECLKRNIPKEIINVIPNGLDFAKVQPCLDENMIIESLKSKLGWSKQEKTLLLSLGRLIPRKGHSWFIENVFVKLPKNFIYLIAGDGPEFEHLREIICKQDLDDRVLLFGYVTDEKKACLFHTADLFIMPNVRDENDQEGFGIVLLEAGSYGLPSIASNIEGIKDAVIDGVSGMLVPEKDAEAFTKAIINPSLDRNKISITLEEKFDWKIISQMYLDAFHSLID